MNLHTVEGWSRERKGENNTDNQLTQYIPRADITYQKYTLGTD